MKNIQFKFGPIRVMESFFISDDFIAEVIFIKIES